MQCCCSVAKSCLTLCNPMGCSMPAFSILHYPQSLLKLMFIESMMLSNHLILYCSLLLLPSFPPNIRVFPKESALCIRLPKYWSFRFSINPSNEYSGLITCSIYWFDLLAVQVLSRVFSTTTVQKHHFFSAQLSLWSNSHMHI